jgi:ubiquinone/menaquinone biosynthesis C-methylase UbiE
MEGGKMGGHDDIRERSGAFYGTSDGPLTLGMREGNIRHNLALRDSLPAFIDRDDFAVLDIGCGRGRVARIVKDVFRQARVFGIDISAEQIERARSFVSDGVFQVGNEISFPFDDDSFDYATCRMSIHHYPDMMSHLREVKRVLRPGGSYLIIDVVPSAGMQDHWLNEVFVAAEREGPGDGHIKFYTIEEYEQFFSQAGLAIGRMTPLPHPLVFPKSVDPRVSVIYKHMLRAPEDFRNSVSFVDEPDQYRCELPTCILAAVIPG